MDLMSLITGGAQPQPGFDERFGAQQANPNLENLLRAIAMQKMQAEPQPQGWPEAAPAAGFQPGGMPQMMPDMSMAGGPGPAPSAPIAPPMPPVIDENGIDAFSSRKATVPLPRPDPRDAMAADTGGQIIRAPGAPPEFPIGMPMQAQPSMQDMLPTGRDRTMKNALSGFAAGIAKMPGNTRGSALGRGFGGAVAGADAAENTDFDQSVKALDQVRKAAAEGDQVGYKNAMAQYYLALAAKYRAEIGPDGTKIAGASKSSGPERMRDWTIEQFKKENNGKEPTLEQLNTLMKNPALERRFQQQLELQDIRESGANARSQARTDSQNFRRDAPSVTERFQQNRGMVTGKKPGEQAAPAEKPAEIDMRGNGSQANPYKPTSDTEYNDMPVGTYYQHPSDPPGKLRIKGKGPA